MTAIYGIVRHGGVGSPADEARLTDSLRQYGRDDVRSIAAGPAWMGRNLGHVVAEDRFDAGPVSCGAGRYVVVADVRLTERDDLARQLDLESWDRLSDAALVAAAIAAWDVDAFDRIYGDFAVAAWDRQGARLLLARDHIGNRPLFYHPSQDRVAFASMPHGLHALPDVPRGFDPESARQFLRFLQPTGSRTHYAQIERVPVG